MTDDEEPTMDDDRTQGTDGRRGEGRAFEQRLHAAMAAGVAATEADVGAPAADLADLRRRSSARARRTRALGAAAAVAVLVAGVAGGWLLGRGDESDEHAGSTPGRGADGPASARAGVVVVDDPELPLVPADPSGGGGTPEQAAFTPDASDAEVDRALGGPWWSGGPWGAEPAATVFRRTLDDGTAFDVRANRHDGGWDGEVPFWDPAPWCFPSGRVYVGVRLPDGVGQAGALRYDAVRDGTLSASMTVVGGPEGDPRWVVVVQVPAAATEVRADLPGGGHDAMEPVDGLAVLSAQVDPSVDLGAPWGQEGPALRLEARGPGGVLASHEGPWGAGVLPTGEVPYDLPECTPPTALPEPGSEQPADPAAARGAVEATWATVFDDVGSQPSVDEVLGLVDEPEGVADALDRLRRGLSEDVRESSTIPIRALVFADATTAYVAYGVEVPAMSLSMGPYFGEVRLVDGTWKVTRATVCGVLGLGGGTCAPLGGG